MTVSAVKEFLRHRLPVAIAPHWSLQWWKNRPEFTFNGKTHRLFCHAHNCGWPTARMTDRSAELSLADAWLSSVSGPVIEIGAVTPYYWPHRVDRIVDPADTHQLVTDHASLFDVDTTGMNVLSISTLEHIGSGEYGLPKEADGPTRALRHITERCANYFITVPYGFHPDVDQNIFGNSPPLPTRYLVRSPDANDWRECSAAEARVPIFSRFGETQRSWSNALAIMTRGGAV